MRIDNYNQPGQVLRLLIPALKARGKETHAIALLQELLKHYAVGGAGDYWRMEFARMINDLSASKEDSKILRLHQLTAVPFSDGKPGEVPGLAAGANGIFGVRKFGGYFTGGEAFRIAPQSKQADIIKGPQAVHTVAYTNKHVAIGTLKNGLYMIDANTLDIRQLTLENSALPGDTISSITDDKGEFLVGILDKDNRYTLFYRLDPNVGHISATGARVLMINYWGAKVGADKTSIVPQTWSARTAMMDGKEITLSAGVTHQAMKDVTVKRDDGETVLAYKGYELTYVNDFIVWQGHLVFVTGNGLYVSKPGSNKLRCILSEPDLLLLTSCIVDDTMVLGTSKGVYMLDAALFAKAALDP